MVWTARRRRRWVLVTSSVGGLLLTTLLTALVVYDHVVIPEGPELLSGRALGAPCTDSEQCRAPLGSATRAAVPKACALVDGVGHCALLCGSSRDCPEGTVCDEGTYRETSTVLPGRLCLPR